MAQSPKPFPLTLDGLRGIVAARVGQARHLRSAPAASGHGGGPPDASYGHEPHAGRHAFRVLDAIDIDTADGEAAEDTSAVPAGGPLIARAIAHELRSTLALISGYSQTVQHLPLDNDVRIRYLERIATASDCLSELTDEILVVAMSPQRAEEPLLEPVSLRQLYAEVAGQIDGAIERLRLCVEIPTDLPLVEADRMWIALVVRNLIENGAKYAAGSTVNVTAWENGEWVVTAVSDGGGGPEAGERGRLFEPRFRGRQARESGTPGSGLGLYLCSRLVEAHGGRIWIEDSTEEFTVCFSLPRARIPFAARGGQGGADGNGGRQRGASA